ncbi:hypothetical protein [Aestuariibius sp. HNIBRBA575]|uniref:hypothetical protein n=1 Tax=Aestuariibius sp. HNIBRBA575 TaxID=3233343 RepID=UPI0034A0D9AC
MSVKVQSTFNDRIKRISRNPHAQPEDLVQIAKQAKRPLKMSKRSGKIKPIKHLFQGAMWMAPAACALKFKSEILSQALKFEEVQPFEAQITLAHTGIVAAFLIGFAFTLRKSGTGFWFVVFGAIAAILATLEPEDVMTKGQAFLDYLLASEDA